ncbi:guanine deaminase isoform X2 [Erpetoichthys calabaricus]|uniref:guanine deaminase isoform X2 n=1 Tax=Erpetoichthys calabaricus TaxID=27687 RepID=UPI002234AFE7|nr:guanine deaminase isoform X2 [Erpetoichthys calabaricus]
MSRGAAAGQVQHVFKGTFAHSTTAEPLQILDNTILGVDINGKIAFIEPGDQEEILCDKWGFSSSDVKSLQDKDFFIPGMVDTHIHAPQYTYAGIAQDYSLMKWLKVFTFPTELKYESKDFAKDVYTKLVKRTLKHGTTTACYFATIHTDSTLLLAEIVEKLGQRALVGKVCMDINDAVRSYREETEECIEETKRLNVQVSVFQYTLVKPIVTPRFAPSCSTQLLNDLGDIAKENDLHIQSHISENKDELNIVKDMFPECGCYTEVYDKYNLLTSKTVMAHGCYLSNKELEIFCSKGSAVAHCPNSNISLCSGMLDVRNVLNHKVKIGLGTDVAGGYSTSMLDAVRKAIETSKILTIQKPGYETLSYKEAFQLATLGGSQALALEDTIGNFEVGKDFDAVLISPTTTDSSFDVFAGDTKKVIFEKFINLGDDRNVMEVYVAGKLVFPSMCFL